MTLYDSRRAHRPRPTLRLRLTLFNSVLVFLSGAFLAILAWVLISDVPSPELELRTGTRVVLSNGQEVDAQAWLDNVVNTAGTQALIRGGLGLLAVGVINVIAGYLIAGRVLRPLKRVTITARRLSGETPDQRIRYAGPDDEVAELAKTFDTVLDRLSAAFDTQRRFVANASHELRTPLAVMRTEIDVTMDDPDVDIEEYQRMGRVVRAASIRANALVESLLLLARTEAQTGRRLARKVPADLACGVVEALAAVRADAERLHLTVETELETAPVVGDPGLLDRLAGNLIENAVRYNHLSGRVWVRTGSDDTWARLVVGNTGYEVEQHDVPVLFEPFRRGGPERTGNRGSGLGLSIVRAVCEAHGGDVTAVALPGGGLEVTVTLPAAAITPVLAGSAPVPRRRAPAASPGR